MESKVIFTFRMNQVDRKDLCGNLFKQILRTGTFLSHIRTTNEKKIHIF